MKLAHIPRLLATAALLLVSACSMQQQTPEQPYIKAGLADFSQHQGTLKRRVILLGDAGHSSLEPLQASLQKASELAKASPEKTSVVMLGDNIYYFGFPNKDEGQEEYSKSQLEDISHLEAQLHIATLSGAEVFVVPGNHDWYATQVDSQAEYVASYGRAHNIQTAFGPHQDNAQPLPEIVHRDGVSLVFIDSMWMIKASDDDFQSAITHLDQLLRDTHQQHPDNIIVVNQHHPIETMGPHNRYYSSLTYKLLIKVLELFMDNDQDLDHPRYQRLTDGLESTLAHYDNIVFAAGHDHSLQVFKDPKGQAPEYRLVSGAANTSKITGVSHNDNTQFALSREGLMVLDVYDNNVTLQVFTIDNDQPVFSQQLDQLQ